MEYTVFAWSSRIDPCPYYLAYDLTDRVFKPRKAGRFTLICEHWKKSLGSEHVYTTIHQTNSEVEAYNLTQSLISQLKNDVYDGCWCNPEKPELDFTYYLSDYLPGLQPYILTPLIKTQRQHILRKALSRAKMYENNRIRNKENRNNPSPEILMPTHLNLIPTLQEKVTEESIQKFESPLGDYFLKKDEEWDPMK